MTELRTSESISAAIAALAEQQQDELAGAAALKATHAAQAGSLNELTAKERKIWAGLPLEILTHEQAAAAIERQLSALRAELVTAGARELVEEARVRAAGRPDVEARGKEIAAKALAEMRALKGESDTHAAGLESIIDKARAFDRANGTAVLVNAGLLVTNDYNGTHVHVDNVAHKVSWVLEGPDLLALYAHEVDRTETMERANAEYEARATEAAAERAAQEAAEAAAREQYTTSVFRDLTPAERAVKEQLAEQEERGIKAMAAFNPPTVQRDAGSYFGTARKG